MFHVKHEAVRILNQQKATARGNSNGQLAVPGEEFLATEQIVCPQGFPGNGQLLRGIRSIGHDHQMLCGICAAVGKYRTVCGKPLQITATQSGMTFADLA